MKWLYSQWPPSAFAYKTALEWIDPIAGYTVEAVNKSLNKKSPAASAIASLPVPTPQLPVTPADAQVLQAQDAFAKANLLKKSPNKFVYAGDTGGYKPGEPGYPGNPAPAPLSYKR